MKPIQQLPRFFDEDDETTAVEPWRKRLDALRQPPRPRRTRSTPSMQAPRPGARSDGPGRS